MQYLSNLIYLPIIFLPLFYWEVPKVWAYIISINLFVLINIIIAFKNKITFKLKFNKLSLLISIFFLWGLFSSLFFGEDKIKSLVGNYYRFDGLVTFLQLFGFSMVFASIYKHKDNFNLSLAIFLSGVISAIWNNFGQVNFLVGFLLTTIPFSFYIINNLKNYFIKALVILGLIVIVKAILLTNSYLGIFGVLIVYPVYLILNQKISKLWILSIVSVFVLIVGLWFNDINKKPEYVAENRVRVYRNVFVGSIRKPISGFGWSNVDKAFEKVTWPLKFNDDIYVDKAHNLFLEVFATTGIIGFSIYIYLVVLLFKKVLQVNDNFIKVVGTSLTMHLIYSSVNVTSISQEFIYWIVIGIIISIYKE